MKLDFLQVTPERLKRSLIIPIGILFLVLVFLIIGYTQHGEILHKGIDLTGGTQLVVHSSTELDIPAFEQFLSTQMQTQDVDILTTTDPATLLQKTVIITVGGEPDMAALLAAVRQFTGLPLDAGTYSVSSLGPALAASFFAQARWAFFFAFLFMAAVVAFYYRKVLPAVAIILSTAYDLVIIVGVMSLLNISLTLASLAAILMIIGYGVDTNILLSNKILKESGGTVYDRVSVGLRTGLTMSATTISVLVALFLVGGAYSLVLRQIALILLIGLLADIPNTWSLNAYLLLWRRK